MRGSPEGGWSCGAVRYRLTSEPLFVHCCHCRNCQRQTGSAYVINVLIQADRVELTSGRQPAAPAVTTARIGAGRVELTAGVPRAVDVPRDDGSAQRIHRCPECQVAVYSEYGRPEVRFVRGGTLEQPSSVAPDVHIFTKSKLPWVTLPEDVPAVEVYYDSKALWPAQSLERRGRRRPRG